MALERAALQLAGGGAAPMLVAYLLSCLGAHPSAALNPVCFNSTRIYFWGGFGDAVPCSGVVTLGGGALVLPPFAVPDAERNVVTAWTMTQRAGSATYHLFTAGTGTFLCFGEVTYLGVLFVVASYLRAHKLFLRL